MITIRTDMTKVRKTCINNDWYTRGNNEEYSYLLNDMCDWDIEQTEESIRDIARNIYEHSTGFDMCYSKNEHIDNIAFYILNDCCTYFMN